LRVLHWNGGIRTDGRKGMKAGNGKNGEREKRIP